MKNNRTLSNTNIKILTPYRRQIIVSVSRRQQGGYALIAVITIMMILGLMATGGVTLSEKTERLAGNSIQRSRSFQAADGAATLAEAKIVDLMTNRIFANSEGSSGIFARNTRDDRWWRSDVVTGGHVADPGSFLGVIESPTFVIEQVGNYVSDGGTGVVSLDVGGASYGRLTNSGREFLLFTVESHGKGSFEGVETVIETTAAFSY